MKKLLAAAAFGTLVSGAALAQPYPAMPPPQAETMPPPPGANYAWEGGHWQWNGVQYGWIPGRYVIRRANYHNWVQGHWANRAGRWVWIPAHWQ